MVDVNEKSNSEKDPSALLLSLLSNPDALSKMSGIIEKYTSNENRDNSPLDENSDKSNVDFTPKEAENTRNIEYSSTTEQSKENQKSSVDFSKLAAIFGNADAEKRKQQTALLLAIRPYLSPRRQELIDGFIGLSRIGGIFKNFT